MTRYEKVWILVLMGMQIPIGAHADQDIPWRKLQEEGQLEEVVKKERVTEKLLQEYAEKNMREFLAKKEDGAIEAISVDAESADRPEETVEVIAQELQKGSVGDLPGRVETSTEKVAYASNEEYVEMLAHELQNDSVGDLPDQVENNAEKVASAGNKEHVKMIAQELPKRSVGDLPDRVESNAEKAARTSNKEEHFDIMNSDERPTEDTLEELEAPRNEEEEDREKHSRRLSDQASCNQRRRVSTTTNYCSQRRRTCETKYCYPDDPWQGSSAPSCDASRPKQCSVSKGCKGVYDNTGVDSDRVCCPQDTTSRVDYADEQDCGCISCPAKSTISSLLSRKDTKYSESQCCEACCETIIVTESSSIGISGDYVLTQDAYHGNSVYKKNGSTYYLYRSTTTTTFWLNTAAVHTKGRWEINDDPNGRRRGTFAAAQSSTGFGCPTSATWTNVQLTCKTCNEYDCDLGYVRKKLGSTLLSDSNCCQACPSSFSAPCPTGYYEAMDGCCEACPSSFSAPCPTGYYEAMNGCCEACIDNCRVCTDDKSCTTCSQGFYQSEITRQANSLVRKWLTSNSVPRPEAGERYSLLCYGCPDMGCGGSEGVSWKELGITAAPDSCLALTTADTFCGTDFIIRILRCYCRAVGKECNPPKRVHMTSDTYWRKKAVLGEYIKASDRAWNCIHGSRGTASSSPLEMGSCEFGTGNVRWQMVPSPTRAGMYYIKAPDRETYIHASGSTSSGNSLTMHSCPKSSDYGNCQWQIVASATRAGMYYIKASDRETYIHASGSTSSGNGLTMHPCPKVSDYGSCQWLLDVPQAVCYDHLNGVRQPEGPGVAIGSEEAQCGACRSSADVDACKAICAAHSSCKSFTYSPKPVLNCNACCLKSQPVLAIDTTITKGTWKTYYQTSCQARQVCQACPSGNAPCPSGYYELSNTCCKAKVPNYLYVSIAEDVLAGATTLKLVDVSGLSAVFLAGLLLTFDGGTSRPVSQSEQKTIVSVNLDSSRRLSSRRLLVPGSVTLDGPLQYSHTQGATAFVNLAQATCNTYSCPSWSSRVNHASYIFTEANCCQVWGCTTSSNGTGCKSCIPQLDRVSDTDCASCNKGYYLSGKTCQAHTCTTGNGSACASCVSFLSRTTNAHCGTCNPGYGISGTICEATCAIFTCPAGYSVQNANSTEFTLGSCCNVIPEDETAAQTLFFIAGAILLAYFAVVLFLLFSESARRCCNRLSALLRGDRQEDRKTNLTEDAEDADLRIEDECRPTMHKVLLCDLTFVCFAVICLVGTSLTVATTLCQGQRTEDCSLLLLPSGSESDNCMTRETGKGYREHRMIETTPSRWGFDFGGFDVGRADASARVGVSCGMSKEIYQETDSSANAGQGYKRPAGIHPAPNIAYDKIQNHWLKFIPVVLGFIVIKIVKAAGLAAHLMPKTFPIPVHIVNMFITEQWLEENLTGHSILHNLKGILNFLTDFILFTWAPNLATLPFSTIVTEDAYKNTLLITYDATQFYVFAVGMFAGPSAYVSAVALDKMFWRKDGDNGAAPGGKKGKWQEGKKGNLARLCAGIARFVVLAVTVGTCFLAYLVASMDASLLFSIDLSILFKFSFVYGLPAWASFFRLFISLLSIVEIGLLIFVTTKRDVVTGNHKKLERAGGVAFCCIRCASKVWRCLPRRRKAQVYKFIDETTIQNLDVQTLDELFEQKNTTLTSIIDINNDIQSAIEDLKADASVFFGAFFSEVKIEVTQEKRKVVYEIYKPKRKDDSEKKDSEEDVIVKLTGRREKNKRRKKNERVEIRKQALYDIMSTTKNKKGVDVQNKGFIVAMEKLNKQIRSFNSLVADEGMQFDVKANRVVARKDPMAEPETLNRVKNAANRLNMALFLMQSELAKVAFTDGFHISNIVRKFLHELKPAMGGFVPKLNIDLVGLPDCKISLDVEIHLPHAINDPCLKKVWGHIINDKDGLIDCMKNAAKRSQELAKQIQDSGVEIRQIAKDHKDSMKEVNKDFGKKIIFTHNVDQLARGLQILKDFIGNFNATAKELNDAIKGFVNDPQDDGTIMKLTEKMATLPEDGDARKKEEITPQIDHDTKPVCQDQEEMANEANKAEANVAKEKVAKEEEAAREAAEKKAVEQAAATEAAARKAEEEAQKDEEKTSSRRPSIKEKAGETFRRISQLSKGSDKDYVQQVDEPKENPGIGRPSGTRA